MSARWFGWLWLLAVGSAAAGLLDLDQAAARVHREIDGRVLGGREVQEEGRLVYVIRVLTPDGRVVHVRVDQATGRILQPPDRKR